MAEEAAGPSATRLTLHQILEDEDLSSKFRDFLGVVRCGENLSFWLEVELFRAMESQGKTKDQIEYVATTRYGHPSCISDPAPDQEDPLSSCVQGSPQEINIDGDQRMQLMMEMSNVRSNLFDRAQRDIQIILETDSIPKFRREPAYMQWLEARAKRAQEKASKSSTRKDKKARDPSKSRQSLFSRLLGRDNDTPPPLDQRQRSNTLESLKVWREQHQRKASSPLSASVPQRAASSSPPAAAESPLTLSAPNPTASVKPSTPLRASKSLVSVRSAVEERDEPKKERPKSGALLVSFSLPEKEKKRPKSGVMP